jgi:hypothetical protein
MTTSSYFKNEIDFPTNMSIKNCKIPRVFETHDTMLFRDDIEPKKEHGYIYLNPSALQSKYATDFFPVKCIGQSCQYRSNDPRLISSSRGGDILTLDSPPIDSKISLDKIYTDKNLNNYGKSYRTYSDINAGQITYYIDKSIKDPFFSPLFSTPISSQGILYRDPMGAFKAQYEREPLISNNPINTHKNYYKGGLSWIEDSQEHREDLLSKQMRKHNEQRWSPRW